MSETPTTPWTPRSPFDEVGGYVWLPRLLDKCRHVTAHPDADYLALDASLVDILFMRGVGVTSASIMGWVHEGLNDEAIAAAIAAQAGHDAAAAAAFSARFVRKFKIVLESFDADEGRMAPGPRQALLKFGSTAVFRIIKALKGKRTEAAPSA